MVDSDLTLALARLAERAARTDIATADEEVRAALDRVLLDSLGVGIAGIRTSEMRAILAAWPAPEGPSSLWGTGRRTDPQTAALLMGTALCSLELDEGNKAARGHPGAHVIPAAIAEAQRLDSPTDLVLSAILAGYEVAAAIATAFHPTPGLHPHGHWGAVGAAVAVGRLYGFTEHQLGEAMDAAAGLALASPFSSALDGSFVRNTWVGVAGSNGITAARLVRAGVGSNETTARSTFGALLGSLDAGALLRSLDGPGAITRGYLKRHASCAYTHPPADAAIEIRRACADVATLDIARIDVATHSLAATLNRTEPGSRLAAMFSVPHVVAVALRDGQCLPAGFDESARRDPELARLRAVTSVTPDPDFDTAFPHNRGARVTITLRSGATHSAEVPDAIGDCDYRPLGSDALRGKLAALLGDRDTARLEGLVHGLATAPTARAAFAALDTPPREEETS